jgi:hypothetical protein
LFRHTTRLSADWPEGRKEGKGKEAERGYLNTTSFALKASRSDLPVGRLLILHLELHHRVLRRFSEGRWIDEGTKCEVRGTGFKLTRVSLLTLMLTGQHESWLAYPLFPE